MHPLSRRGAVGHPLLKQAMTSLSKPGFCLGFDRLCVNSVFLPQLSLNLHQLSGFASAFVGFASTRPIRCLLYFLLVTFCQLDSLSIQYACMQILRAVREGIRFRPSLCGRQWFALSEYKFADDAETLP